MAYVSRELKAKLAPKIKEICKKYGVKATLAVRNHSTLVLNIKSAKINMIEDCKGEKRHISHIQVNTYWYDSNYVGKTKDFLAEVIPAMKGDEFYDNSDVQSDYFDVSHYIDINIGKWDVPFVFEQ